MPRPTIYRRCRCNKQVSKLKARAVDAPGRGRGKGEQLTVLAPADTVRALRIAAAERTTTVRALVLEALAKAGWPVPKDEMRDRRR